MTFHVGLHAWPKCHFLESLVRFIDPSMTTKWTGAAERAEDYWEHTLGSATGYLGGRFSGIICPQQLHIGPSTLHCSLQLPAIIL